MRALVLGASGYVGSALAGALAERGDDVVAAGRSVARLGDAPWASRVRTLAMDVRDADSVRQGLSKCGPLDVAYYLVHSLDDDNYQTLDRQAAETFAAAAAIAPVRRIVYLGGMIPPAAERVSSHLRSRDQVGQALSDGAAGTVCLQAAAVIGSGSTPFELMRQLADRLKVIPLPPFMSRPMQPIGIGDVLHYLIASADPGALPAGKYDIGGERVTTYAGLIRIYAEVAGLSRIFVPVPWVTPGAAASLIGPLTRLNRELIGNLMPSLSNTMISSNRRIREYIADPLGGLMDPGESIAAALDSMPPAWPG